MSTSNPNTHMLLSFILLLLIAAVTGYYAEKKGRSYMMWFILSLILGIFAPLILLFLPSVRPEDTGEPTMKIFPPAPELKPLSTQIPPKQEVSSDIENKLWYYLDQNHQQYGPVSLLALKELWNSGLLELNSYVWVEGMEKWEKVDNLPELKEALKKHSL